MPWGSPAPTSTRALADGSIIRTHVLRPTWHLVTPADIRWMLALTAPRVKALAAYGNRQSGLDAATISKASRVLATALRGGRQLTRVELTEALRQAGIEPRDALGFGRLTARRRARRRRLQRRAAR